MSELLSLITFADLAEISKAGKGRQKAGMSSDSSSSSLSSTPAPQDSSTSEGKGRGFLLDIVLNSIEPGVNTSVLIFLNGVFVVLLGTLAVVAVVTGLNVHIIFLGILALGLMVGFNLFISQLPSTGVGEKPNDVKENSRDSESPNRRLKQE